MFTTTAHASYSSLPFLRDIDFRITPSSNTYEYQYLWDCQVTDLMLANMEKDEDSEEEEPESGSINSLLLHFSQKHLSRRKKSRLVIVDCAGYISWKVFLRLLLFPVLKFLDNLPLNPVHVQSEHLYDAAYTLKLYTSSLFRCCG